LFDGICHLCNGLVDFVIARDPAAHFRFASLQSDAARRVLSDVNAEHPLPDSFVLVEDGRLFMRSDAALRIARRLGVPWSLAYGLTVLPRCSYVRAYMRRHPETHSLLAPESTT